MSSNKNNNSRQAASNGVKAVIAAAGMGTRLHPLTLNTPKCLLDINGRAIIDYYLDTLSRLGFEKKDIAVVVGFCKDKIKEHLRGGDYTFIDNDEYASTNNMYSFYLAKNFIGDNDVLYIESDLFFHPDILKNCLEKNDNENYLVVDTKKWTDESMRVKIKNDCVVYASKQISDEECGGDWIGIAKMKSAMLPALYLMIEKALARGERNIYMEIAAFNPLVAETEHKFHVSPTGGMPWIEIDFEHELRKAREEIYPAIFGEK